MTSYSLLDKRESPICVEQNSSVVRLRSIACLRSNEDSLFSCPYQETVEKFL